MIKLEYESSTLSAYPMLEGMAVNCGPDGVGLGGPGAPPIVAAYGTVRLLDLGTGRHAAPTNRRQCLAEAGAYVAGPLYLSSGY